MDAFVGKWIQSLHLKLPQSHETSNFRILTLTPSKTNQKYQLENCRKSINKYRSSFSSLYALKCRKCMRLDLKRKKYNI